MTMVEILFQFVKMQFVMDLIHLIKRGQRRWFCKKKKGHEEIELPRAVAWLSKEKTKRPKMRDRVLFRKNGLKL